MSEYSIALEKQLEMGRAFASMGQFFRANAKQLEGFLKDNDKAAQDVMAVFELNRLLNEAETFYVSSSIQRLLTDSAYAPGLELFRLADFRPPTRSGFVYFHDPLVAEPDRDGDRYNCFAWIATTIGVGEDGPKSWIDQAGRVSDPTPIDLGNRQTKLRVGIFALSLQPEEGPNGMRNYPNQVIDWDDDESLGDVLSRPAMTDRDTNDKAGMELRRLLARLLPTFCGFIAQHVLQSTPRPVDRAARRRVMHSQPEREPVVNVIELRRRSPHATSAAQESMDVEWSHQWLVRGHWRRQWYPKREMHQMIYITPYVKGPEDKPLKQPRATVFAVVR